MSGVGEADNAFAALATFEESVSREEASAQAFEQLAVDDSKTLEDEFQALEGGDVDDELAALKKELEGDK